jgi:hypothetical protein
VALLLISVPQIEASLNIIKLRSLKFNKLLSISVLNIDLTNLTGYTNKHYIIYLKGFFNYANYR